MPGKRKGSYGGDAPHHKIMRISRPLPYKGPISASAFASLKRASAVAGGRRRVGYSRSTGFYGRFPPAGDELKFFDTAISFSLDATGEVPATGQLNLIPQGVTESQRVGRKCIIKSLLLTFNVLLTPAASATASDVAVIYVMLDTQANGAAAAITDVFTSGTNLPSALRNLSNVDRFRVLKKIKMQYSPKAGVTTAYNTETIHKEVYLKNLHIPLEFSSTTGAITEIRSNNIFLCAGAYGLDDVATVAGNCRVRFDDA